MKYEVYSELTITDDFSVFNFVSVGKNGSIRKRITFTPTELKHIYTMAFGDINEHDEIDDYIVSDNGDRNKLLATVENVINQYTKKYPDRWIYFRGSTKERTRLYRMAVGINLHELSTRYDIYAFVENGITPFRKNVETHSFLIKRKII